MNIRLFLLITAVPVVLILAILNGAFNLITAGWWFGFLDEYSWIAFIQFIFGMIIGCPLVKVLLDEYWD